MGQGTGAHIEHQNATEGTIGQGDTTGDAEISLIGDAPLVGGGEINDVFRRGTMKTKIFAVGGVAPFCHGLVGDDNLAASVDKINVFVEAFFKTKTGNEFIGLLDRTGVQVITAHSAQEIVGLTDDLARVFNEGVVGEHGFALRPLEFFTLDLMIKPDQADACSDNKQSNNAPQQQQA